MKVYQFNLRVAVSDDTTEDTLLGPLQFLVAELCGDPKSAPPFRGQAKVTLEHVTEGAGDDADQATWNIKACNALGKQDQFDLFDDLRDNPTRRRASDSGWQHH